jgi:uncharacterized protein YndB with AHSA1/START domain
MDADGTLEQAGDRWRLRFTRRLAHPPAKVWRAITEAEHLDAWFPSTVEGDRAPGAKLRFDFSADPNVPDAMVLDGEVLEWQPPERFAFLWGEDELRFELAPDGDGTVLTFTDTFDEQGKAARDAAGWHTCLVLLGHHVDGDEPPAPSEELWAQVHPAYVEKFGPEAATVGPPGR